MDVAGEFVVGVNRAVVERARAKTLGWSMFSAVTDLVAAAIMALLGGVIVWLAGLVGLLEFLVVLLFAYSGVRKLRGMARLRRTWQSAEVVAEAMRLSQAGVRINADNGSAPVFLPWDAVLGFRIHRWLGKQLLVVDLAPQVDADTPGVEGLGQPAVRNMLHRRIHGTTGLRASVDIFDQPLQAIDHAAASFTAGRVRVR
ncbi:hypothetical protein [Nocardia jiangxiensis]|uniref:RDD family protein n=1 Tax=Nocardia jiangxiensis TaxID=282685 RepID=A0ABW6RT71_9NOCA|nr:hypothetical protein [Nocardia jiangxiensis]